MLHQSEAVNILKMKLQQMKVKLCEGGGAEVEGSILFSAPSPPPTPTLIYFAPPPLQRKSWSRFNFYPTIFILPQFFFFPAPCVPILLCVAPPLSHNLWGALKGPCAFACSSGVPVVGQNNVKKRNKKNKNTKKTNNHKKVRHHSVFHKFCARFSACRL